MLLSTFSRAAAPTLLLRRGVGSTRALGQFSDSTSELSTELSPVVEKRLAPGLYLVATPIGNLEDITLRALRVLRTADVVLAEDTRHTQLLLRHFSIRAPELISYHEHNRQAREAEIIDKLKRGGTVALVSDAGTPGISDPGADLARAAIREGLPVVPVPGAAAVITALVGSGLPTEEFYFAGFLPPKSAQRKERLRALQSVTATCVFYVPPHGLRAVLDDFIEVWGGHRQACVSRELTKIHEEFHRGTLSEAAAEFTQREPRGEIVLLVGGAAAADTAAMDATDEQVDRRASELLASGLRVTEVAKIVADEFSIPRKSIYTKLVASTGSKRPVDAAGMEGGAAAEAAGASSKDKGVRVRGGGGTGARRSKRGQESQDS